MEYTTLKTQQIPYVYIYKCITLVTSYELTCPSEEQTDDRRWRTTPAAAPLVAAPSSALPGRPSAARRPTGRSGRWRATPATSRCTRHGTGACTWAAAAPSRRAAPRRGTPSTAPPRRRRCPCALTTGCRRTPGAW